MRKESCLLLFGLFLSLITSFPLSAQHTEYSFQTRSATEGFTLKRSDAASVTVLHSLPTIALDDFTDNGYAGQVIELNGIYLPADAGAPNLPANSRFIAMPNGSSAHLHILSANKQTIRNVELLPASAIPAGNDDSPAKYEQDIKIYSQDAFYPAEPFRLSEPINFRGVETVILSITPFQYNPVTKELVVYYDVEAEVVFDGGTSEIGVNRLRNPWWDVILHDNILNSNIIPGVDYAKRTVENNASRETGCDYLIIAPTGAAFMQWADTIRVFRQRQGISTKVVSIAEVGGNTVNAIENYVNNAYNTWNPAPAAVLMLGDYSTNGAEGIISHSLNDHPSGYNPYISDNPFADVNNDKLPDIAFARITARNAAELQHMINKFLKYERNPPTSANFYNKPITAMGWQTERWFQLCSEITNGFWQHSLGKTPVRENAIYSGTPGGTWSSNTNTATIVNYFGPNGLNYIPANTAHLTDWGGNATRINADINSGAFMLQHRDHGLETGWGEPDYRNVNIDGLSNTDLTFVMSINCLTGKFDYSSECFAEKFHRYSHGALGLLAATEVSYSFVNDVFVWGAYDNMWPQFMPAFGSNPLPRGILPAFANVAGKYFLQQSNWPYNPEHKNITYNLFHQHGDAFMTVYSEMPQNLVVNHSSVLLSGMDSFDVTANVGALIALTANNEIIGTAVAQDGVTSVPIIPQLPGVEIRVTITLQNYYRYEQVISCIPPSGPYVIYSASTLNDVNGNNNGQIDFNENILMDIALKNVGSEMANNVQATASSESPYLSFINNTFTAGNVAAGALINIPSAIQFQIADNVPDNQLIPITLTMHSGSNEWNGQFAVRAYAPAFSVGTMSISDAQGNGNGRLDPGETATISITATNTGHSKALQTNALLQVTSPYITVATNSMIFSEVNVNQTITAVYTVTVAGNAPVGHVAGLNFSINSGAYTASQVFNAKIGLIIEDFETGNMSQFNWTSGGNLPWTVVNTGAYAGTYAAKSGAIGNNQSTQLILTYEVGAADSISFYYKASSEANYDKLSFYIGNTKMGEWSGNVGWAKVSYAVQAGLNTFKWEYKKDVSVASGSDCAWIDDIVFPAGIMTTAWAGNDLSVCEWNPVQLNGTATNYSSLQWTSAGSGSFNNPNILNPIYTPSSADYQSGNVILTLTVTGTTTISDAVVATFNPQALAFSGTGQTLCQGNSYSLDAASALNYSGLQWTSSGDGVFDHATQLNPVYTPGTADLAAGFVELTLTASPLGGCNPVSHSHILSFFPTVQVNTGNDAALCANTNFLTETATASNYVSLLWSTSGDGSFDNPASLSTVYIPGSGDIANGNVILTLSVESEGGCASASDEIQLTIHPVPTVTLSPDQTICDGDEAVVEFTLTGEAPWTLHLNTTNNPVIVESTPWQMSLSPNQTLDVIVSKVIDQQCTAITDVHSQILVNHIPAQASVLNGPAMIDLGEGLTTIFDIQAVAEALTYEASLSPSNAGTIAVNGLQSIVSWNNEFKGVAEIVIRATNTCGIGEWSPVKTVEVKNTIGLDETSLNGLKIYPNPGQSYCTIELPAGLSDNAILIMADMSGKTLNTRELSSAISKGRLSLNVSQLEKGVYMVIITDDNKTYRQRFVRN
ncbi:hypothetical protein MASR2M12_04180 [Bacteroidales bacterium]